MAWTTPRTWTDTELVTAAIMNPHIRDNFNALGLHLLVRKPSDESVTSSTTFQADDHLLVNIPANEVWLLEWRIVFAAASAGDLKWRWTFPTGGVLTATTPSNDSNNAVQVVNTHATTSPSGQVTVAGTASPDLNMYTSEMLYANAGTAGNIVLEWAQSASSATPTTIKVNSTLWGVKLA